MFSFDVWKRQALARHQASDTVGPGLRGRVEDGVGGFTWPHDLNLRCGPPSCGLLVSGLTVRVSLAISSVPCGYPHGVFTSPSGFQRGLLVPRTGHSVVQPFWV